MLIRRILCAFAVLLAGSAFAQSAPSPQDPTKFTQEQIEHVEAPEVLMRLAAMYKQSTDYQRLSWALERLVELRPNMGDVRLTLATSYAMLGDKTKTYDALLKLQRAGYGYDLSDNPNFSKVSDTKVWGYIVDNLKKSLEPFGEGKVAFKLPGGDTLVDSIAWDAKRRQFLVGSVRDGSIQRVDEHGKVSDFIKADTNNGLWSVYALAVDADNDVLYVASTSSVYFKKFAQADFGKAGVFKFSLADGKLLDKYLLEPGKAQNTLSSIAVGPNNEVFAADGLRNIIYRVDGGSLKPFMENPRLTSVRGITVSADGRFLYFADYTLGIFGVDLAAGRAFDLQYDPEKLALGGIDGLSWYDNHLITVQSGMSPKRVMRLSLGADGRRVIDSMPLDAGHPQFQLPTNGTVAGDGFYFIANSQKNQYDAYGNPKDESKLQAVEVFRSNIVFVWDKSKHESLSQAATVVSESHPGSGRFGNVEGGSTSVSGN